MNYSTPQKKRMVLVLFMIILFTNCDYGNKYNGYRLKYIDNENKKEKVMINSLDSMIDDWWKNFAENRHNIIDYFKQQSNFDISDFMNNSLHRIHPQLMYEYGPAVMKDGYRLVITPENRKDLRPLTNRILQKAPNFPDWEFYPYRLAESFDEANETVKQRTGGKIDDLLVLTNISEINTIELIFIRSGIEPEEEKRQAFNDAFIGLESFLGEEMLDKWIGTIDVIGQIPDDEQPIEMKELKELIESEKAKIRSSLFKKPLYEYAGNAEWIGYKLKPKESEDYILKADLFAASTMMPKVFQIFHSDQLFYSERFSNFNETFLFVKIDEWQNLQDNDENWKNKVIDILEQEIEGSKLGACIGSGTGLRYSYLDLACIDVVKSAQIIKQTLQKINVSKRSWIQFYDSDLSTEWIGIWPDSPPPPMQNHEIQEIEEEGT
jgi:hypothetical protein